MPNGPLSSFFISILEQRVEICWIKLFVVYFRKVGFDVSEVVIDAISFRRGVNP